MAAANDKDKTTSQESESTDSTSDSPQLPRSPRGTELGNGAATSSTGEQAGDNYLTPRTAGDNRPANDHSTAQDQGAPKGLTQTEAVASTDSTDELSPSTPTTRTTSRSTQAVSTSRILTSDVSATKRKRIAGVPRPPLNLSDTPARFPRYWAEELSATDRSAVDDVIEDMGLTATPGIRAAVIGHFVNGADDDTPVPTDPATGFSF